uniref:Uncharacterized protein n=1 Tax=Anguilla anguilla TaxID=7936 RepID=A0A0E9R0L7_ANGAN
MRSLKGDHCDPFKWKMIRLSPECLAQMKEEQMAEGVRLALIT